MTQLPENLEIEHRLHRLEELLGRQASLIACITFLTELLMPGQAEALTTIAELRQAIVDDQTSDQAVVTKLDAALAAAVANADTQPLIDAIREAKAQIVPVTSPNA